MSDIEEIPVETVAGHRSASAAGERLMIGLAVVALLGGALIAVGNVLSNFSDEAAAASPSARAGETARPDRTPRPSPTPRPLREVTVVSGEPSEVPAPPTFEYAVYWVQALEDLPVHGARSDDSPVRDVLAAGDVVLANDQGSDPAMWLHVEDGALRGWIRVGGSQGQTFASVRPVAQGFWDGGVADVAAGPTGFVANGSGPLLAPSNPVPSTVSSVDGEQWRVATDPATQVPWGGWAAAWGPSGWLAVTPSPEGEPLGMRVWESRDGSTWTSLGVLAIGRDQFVTDFVASDLGYLLSVSSYDRIASELRLWYSPDGLTWQESDPGLEVGADGGRSGPGGLRLHATASGYMAWARFDGEYRRTEIAISSNGRSWRTIPLSTDGTGMFEVTTVGDVVLALGLDERGRTRTWRGRLVGDDLEMAAAPHLELAFDGAVVTALTADGERAYAFGYAREDGSSRAWVSAGVSWLRLPAPDGGFGAIPRHVAAGPDGVVVVGARRNATSSGPLFWHLRADGSWRAENDPVIPGLAEPSPDDCPAPPTTAYGFMTLEPAIAVACFGDEPLSFVAWSGECNGCWDEGAPEAAGDWLRQPARFFMLIPYEGDMDSGWWRQAVPHPTLAWDDEWSGTWLRITGHFADPEAQRCGAGPSAGEEEWWEGPEANLHWCRQTFVVTVADPVRAP